MKTELRDKWVEALRSGKYRQTKDVLRNRGNAYCCLGVLCEVMKVGKVYSKNNRVYMYSTSYDMLDDILLKRAGIRSNTQNKLMTMNDGGAKFPEIANWIEKNVRPHRKGK